MLKEQAISLLTQVKEIILGSESWLDSTHKPIEEAFSMAIEALTNTSNALDTVYRQMVIDEIEERINANSLGGNVALISELNRLEGYILHLSSAQQKPLKYTGESICLCCQTTNCDGCVYEPMEGVQ